MRARIFQQSSSVAQSGTSGSTKWLIEFPQSERRQPDALMGWWGSGDTQTQVHLQFDTKEEAIAYADRAGLTYDVELPPIRVFTPKVYADNFKFDRAENWTH